jgi:hypothetical protein
VEEQEEQLPGPSGSPTRQGVKGSDSIFLTITSTGGGGGRR